MWACVCVSIYVCVYVKEMKYTKTSNWNYSSNISTFSNVSSSTYYNSRTVLHICFSPEVVVGHVSFCEIARLENHRCETVTTGGRCVVWLNHLVCVDYNEIVLISVASHVFKIS